MEALFQVQRSTRKTLPILDTNIPIYSKTFFRIKLPIQGWGWKETCLVLPEITSIKWICLRKIPLKRYSPHYQVDIPLGNSTNPGKSPPARWLCRKGTLQLEGWKNRSICKYIHHKSYTGVTGDNHLGVEIPFFKKRRLLHTAFTHTFSHAIDFPMHITCQKAISIGFPNIAMGKTCYFSANAPVSAPTWQTQEQFPVQWSSQIEKLPFLSMEIVDFSTCSEMGFWWEKTWRNPL